MGIELLIAAFIGLGVGAAALAFAKPRESYGIALFPAVGTITALLYWVVASWSMRLFDWTWLRYDAGLIWFFLVAVVAGVALGLAFTLPRRRAEDDADLLDRLIHRGALNS